MLVGAILLLLAPLPQYRSCAPAQITEYLEKRKQSFITQVTYTKHGYDHKKSSPCSSQKLSKLSLYSEKHKVNALIM